MLGTSAAPCASLPTCTAAQGCALTRLPTMRCAMPLHTRARGLPAASGLVALAAAYAPSAAPAAAPPAKPPAGQSPAAAPAAQAPQPGAPAAPTSPPAPIALDLGIISG